MKKLIVSSIAAVFMTSSLSGCIGQMATSGLVMKANLSVVDNRYARAGLYMLMSPVYGIAASADLFVVNTIEFWTGKNPITGKPAVADTPAKAVIQVNDKVGQSLSTAPLKISAAEIQKVDDETLEMYVSNQAGKQQLLRGQKKGDEVHFFLDDELISVTAITELQNYVETRV